MISIDIPDKTNTTIDTPLDGETYQITFTYNEISKSTYMDISKDDELIISSVKLKTGNLLLNKYVIETLGDGDFFVAKVEDTDENVSRYNIGIGKPYELIFFSGSEVGL